MSEEQAAPQAQPPSSGDPRDAPPNAPESASPYPPGGASPYPPGGMSPYAPGGPSPYAPDGAPPVSPWAAPGAPYPASGAGASYPASGPGGASSGGPSSAAPYPGQSSPYGPYGSYPATASPGSSYPASGAGAPAYPAGGPESSPVSGPAYPHQVRAVPPPYVPPPPVQVVPGQQLAPPMGYPGYGQPSGPGFGGAPAAGYPPQHPGYAGAPRVPDPLAMRVDSIEGTQFGVAYPAVPPTPSGTSIASLVAGIASILVSFVVGCFGLTGSSDGWGPAVSGAFAVLAAFIGAGAIGAGVNGTRQIRRSGGTVRGRGLALAGISCGGSGIGLTVLFFLGAVALTAGS